ncbi:6174_t:CDS:2, partial [Racocetra persica]
TNYVTYYKTYKQAAEEFDPDLFLCDFLTNYPCFDLAWKLGKPAVGITSVLSRVVSNPLYKSDPIHSGCHVNMENEPFYDRFVCATIAPLRKFWLFMLIMYDVNVQRAKVGIDSHWDPR